MSEQSAENDAPFYRNTETGEPCPRRGNVLCTLPWTPEHRHAHREPSLTLTVEPGNAPVSALGMVEALARVIPPAEKGPRRNYWPDSSRQNWCPCVEGDPHLCKPELHPTSPIHGSGRIPPEDNSSTRQG